MMAFYIINVYHIDTSLTLILKRLYINLKQVTFT